MSLEQMKDFSFKHSDQQDAIYTQYTGQQVKALFDSRGDELRKFLNDLITSLSSGQGAKNVALTTITDFTGNNVQDVFQNIHDILKSKLDSNSGADFIGATVIPGVTGETIQAILEGLKKCIDDLNITSYAKKEDLLKTTGATMVKTANGDDVETALGKKVEKNGDFTGTWNGVKFDNSQIAVNAELLGARHDNINDTDYDNLGKRLDDHSSQLADKANQSDLGNKANLPTTDKSSFEKAVIEMFNLLISKLDKTGTITVSQISKNGGLIDQTYLTPELIQQIAGTAQVNAIPADKSITPDKTTYLRLKRGNLFDQSKAVSGVVGSGTGNIVADSGYYASDYIPILVTKTYYTTPSYDGAWYNSSKVFISGFTASHVQKVVTPPANAAYLRVTVANADLNVYMVSEDSLPTSYVPYSQYSFDVVDSAFTNLINALISVQPNNTTFFKEVRLNLFNKVNTTPGIVYSGTGAITNSSLYMASEYIPVTAGKTYYTTPSYDGAWYDSSKVFISGFTASHVQKVVTPPANAAYLRVTVANADIDSYMLSVDNLPSSYIPYTQTTLQFTTSQYKQDILGQVSTTSKWANKVWNGFGDSITEVNATADTKYYDVIKSKIGCTFNNYGLSGTGYGTPYTQNSFLSIADRYSSAVDADLITVFAGTNDWGRNLITLGTFGDTTESTFYGAVDMVLSGLINKYPTKTIAVITPLPRSTDNTLNTNGESLQQYVDAIKTVANKYAIPCLDLHACSGFFPRNATQQTTFMPDGLHPNNAGHGRIADKILAFLNSL